MMRALFALLLAGSAAPAMAQHAGHTATPPAPPPSTPTCTAEHAAMGHCKLPTPAQAPAATCTAEHAAMGHCKLPTTPAPPPAPACTAEHAAMGHCKLPAPPPPPAPAPRSPSCPPEHAAMGHCKPDDAADPHAGHGGAADAPAVAPPPPEALSGPAHAADAVFGEAAMAEARRTLVDEHGKILASKLLIDQLEARIGDGRDGYFLNAEGWYGGDIDKLWLKTEIEGDRGRKPEQAEVQALWSRAIDPWFDLQTGVRFDANRGPNRTHLVLGIQGLAPYWWEIDGAVFLSNKGEVTARAEAEYDLRITQQLILQPRIELDLSAQNIRELGIGAGLSTADLGLRLRYQVSQQFSPYIGVSYERAFGNTATYRRDEGEKAGTLKLVTGLRLWF